MPSERSCSVPARAPVLLATSRACGRGFPESRPVGVASPCPALWAWLPSPLLRLTLPTTTRCWMSALQGVSCSPRRRPRSFFLGAVGFLPSRGRPGLRVAEAWACADSLYPRLVPLRARPCPPRGSRF